jgi:hypothetical protein
MLSTQTRSQANLCNIPRKVKVFDVEKKALIQEFETMTGAARFCGLDPREVARHIKSKSRSNNNSLNKTICFR